MGEKALNERDVEGVLGGFKGKRAFGGKMGGMSGGIGGGKREEVFRYREFVGSVVGGGEVGESVGTK